MCLGVPLLGDDALNLLGIKCDGTGQAEASQRHPSIAYLYDKDKKQKTVLGQAFAQFGVWYTPRT